VRLYFWLADVLWWRNRYEMMSQIVEEGLALLGDAEAESVEAAVMNDLAAECCIVKGDSEKVRQFTLRNATFLRRLPYSEELRPAYSGLLSLYAYRDRNPEEEMSWLQALKRQAEEHYDLRALAHVYAWTGSILARQGDFQGSLPFRQQAVDLITRIGDAKHQSWYLLGMTHDLLAVGELGKAEELVSRASELTQQVLQKGDIAWCHNQSGILSLCQGLWQQAGDAFQKAAHLVQELGFPGVGPQLLLGRTHLAQGEYPQALGQFAAALTAALTSDSPGSDQLASMLSGLETAQQDAAAFHAFCGLLREEHPELNASPLVQWFLEVAEPDGVFRRSEGELPTSADEIQNPGGEFQNGGWIWHDPFGDCASTVQHGVQISVANGRDLRDMNRSAPRLLRPVAGDLAAQTVCLPASEEKPAIGGLLLWKDPENYLRLERGTRGEHEISFQGCLGNKDIVIGRGRLLSERVHLRLERLGPRVNALCSADGMDWFTLGFVEFPVEDPVEVGLHAIGMIDRTIYPGAYPEGTAIRFESFRLWG
jgi:tetratricopeptide (TPR) repeat protein